MFRPMSTIFASSRGALLLTFFKRRWLRDVTDLLEASVADGQTLAFDDVDMDNDLLELGRVSGPEALTELAREVLRGGAPLEAQLARESLAPELEGAQAEAFLRLLAVNIAFRLRSDALLADLVAFAAEGSAPRLGPADLGQLLARARTRSEAQALIEGSGLSPADQASAREALALPALEEVELFGTRIHVQADAEALENAIDRALRPLERAGWTQGVGSPIRRRLLAHKQRGGWFTVLEEGDATPVEFAQQLARSAGVQRVAWLQAGMTPDDLDLRVFEGTRCILDRASLAARTGGEVDARDAAAALRALGVLDLDPGHARGLPALRWAQAAGLEFKKKSIRSFCYL